MKLRLNTNACKQREFMVSSLLINSLSLQSTSQNLRLNEQKIWDFVPKESSLFS